MTPALPVWYTRPRRPAAINRTGPDGRVWRVTVIVPTRNEAVNLRPVLEVAAPFADELLVVDGHSNDDTRQIAEAMGATVVLDNARGKGDALRVGMARATGDVLVFVDADGSHDPRDIPALVQPIIDGHADHISGSRMLGGSDELHATLHQFVRLFGSQIITLSVNYTQNVRLTDCQNGFRAIRRDVALALGLQENITTIEQEMVIKTVRLGYRLGEVATHEYVRANGESNFRVLDVWPRYVRSWLYYLLLWRPHRAQIEALTQRRKDAETNALAVSTPKQKG
ncbi:MAG: glycosyltransferase family 2 protein [Chloroflexi bacterium]|nr:glycosyltransferase family 2 protein [Chloroflexota bacterium]